LGGGLGIANVYYAGLDRLSVRELSRNSVAYALVGSAVGAGIVATLAGTELLDALLPGVPRGIALLAMAMLPSGLLQSSLLAILQGRRRIGTANAISVAQGACTLLLIGLLVAGVRLGLLGGVLAYLGGSLLAVLLAARFLRKAGARFTPAFDRPVIAQTLHFGLRGYAANVLQFFSYRLDVFLVNFYLGPAAVGIYGASVAVAELIWHLPHAVGFVIFPKAASTPAEDMNRFTPRVFAISLAISALAGGALALVGRWLISLVYGAAFLAAYRPLLLLLPGVILLGGGKVLTNEIAGRGYPHYNSIASAAGLIITIALDVLLIPRLGIDGAALASTAAYTATFILAGLFYRRVSRRRAEAPPGAR
jgi:O-antigen/teichoic acid export membrane protein